MGNLAHQILWGEYGPGDSENYTPWATRETQVGRAFDIYHQFASFDTVFSETNGTLLSSNTHTPWSQYLGLQPTFWANLEKKPSTIRANLSWGLLEPNGASTVTGGALAPSGKAAECLYDLDDSLSQLSAAVPGVKFLLTVDACPWYGGGSDPVTSNGGSIWCDPGGPGTPYAEDTSTPGHLARFLAWIAARYPGQIDSFEIVNEVGYFYTFWSGTDHDRIYANILKACSTAIKAVDPSIKVTNGSTLNVQNESKGAQLVQGLIENGCLPYIDAINVHNYPKHVWYESGQLTAYNNLNAPVYNSSDKRLGVISMIETWVMPMLAAAGAQDMEVWLTEIGWSTVLVDNAGPILTQQQQADKVTELIEAVVTRPWGSNINLTRVYHYEMAGSDGWGLEDGTNATLAYTPFSQAVKNGTTDTSTGVVKASSVTARVAIPAPTITGATTGGTQWTESFEYASSGNIVAGTGNNLSAVFGATYSVAPGGRGGNCAKLVATGNLQWISAIDAPVSTGTLYMRCYYLYSVAAPAQWGKIAGFEDHQGTYVSNGFNTVTTGSVGIKAACLSALFGSTLTLTIDTWYRLEVDTDYDSNTVTSRVYLGDSTTALLSSTTTWSPLTGRADNNGIASALEFRNDGAGSAIVYFDDVAFSTTAQPGPL